MRCLIEIDRKGSNDAVFYDCYNKDFEAYIISKGFKSACGSFSDISLIAPELGIAAVNLSSGYYNAHTLHEFINRAELEAVISTVGDIINDTIRDDFPRYEYIAKSSLLRQFSYSGWKFGSYYENDDFFSEILSPDEIFVEPRKLPSKYQQIYDELLEIYSVAELEELRSACGDQILLEIYLDLCYNNEK